ncbi:MAG: tRNA lysidine(34) synthetase TilS, partial [Parabacteroides sp.]|nr:tRNA lysidine(34) synthetase TilS [Parabacteroides sp.]
ESLEIEIQEKTLFKEYGDVGAYLTPSSYSFVYNEITFVEEENFKIVEEADSFHSCTVSEDDFPLTIRSFKKGDRISMRYGHKKVSRFFIDQKIPSQKRKVWPIVLNAKNEVILVPKIGCDQYHYSTKPNLFVIE